MSRARWLAFGSTLAVVGCLDPSAMAPESKPDAGGPDAEGSPDADGSPDVGRSPDASRPAPRGTFLCRTDTGGTVPCDRATQYCQTGPNAQLGCFVDSDPASPVTFPSRCLASPTCDCLADAALGSCSCSTLDDAGAIGVSCHSCYGSPPARLERLRHVVG